MTREEAKKLVPIIKAFGDGLDVELRVNEEWTKLRNPAFSDHPDDYRIKPDPKLRPWLAEEVPPLALYRRKAWVETDKGSWSVIVGVHWGRIEYGIGNSSSGCDKFDEALEKSEHSTDNGKTWLPCGVLEDA
jgi:hypothetical protein